MEIQENRKWFLLLDKNSFAASHSKTFLWTPTVWNFFKDKLQLNRRRSVKKMFLKVSQNAQENTCAAFSLFLETLLWSDSSTGDFLWSLQIFSGRVSCKTPENGCFCVDLFLEVFRKFQKIFKSTNEKMLLVYIVHIAILKGNLHK